MSEEVKNEEKKDETKNIVTVEQIGPCRKKVTIEVPEEEIKDIVASQYKDLRKEAVIPGFRKGRTPLRLLEKRFGKDINEQTKLKILADATEKALEEHKIDTLGDPDINHEDYTLPESGSFTFSFEANVRPEFDLPALDKIKIEKPVFEVTDERVEERLASIRKNFGKLEARQEGQGAEEGDTIVADVVITPEGEESINVEGTDVIVKDSGFCAKVPVEDLGKQLVGTKAGEEKTFSTQVPEDFFNKELAGKKCEVKVSVKEVKYLKEAELNEELFDKLGVDDADALKERITDLLEDQNEKQAREAMSQTITDYLLDNTSFDMPESIITEQADSIVKRQYTRLLMQGLSEEELKRKTEELQTSSKDEAYKTFKSFFIMDKLANEFDIEVTQEEINGYIAQVAMYQGSRPEKIREQLLRDGSLTEFTVQAREWKCIDKLIEMNLPKEEKPEEKPQQQTAEQDEEKAEE